MAVRIATGNSWKKKNVPFSAAESGGIHTK
jgi:hypothetical protein